MMVWVRFVWSWLVRSWFVWSWFVWLWFVHRFGFVWCWLVVWVWLVWLYFWIVSFTFIGDFLMDLVVLVSIVGNSLLAAIRKMDIVYARLAALLIYLLLVSKVSAMVVIIYCKF